MSCVFVLVEPRVMDKDDAKSRGVKHRTVKKKYNKNKPPTHVPPSKPKVSLESNWDRYEIKEVENKVTSSTDFAVLANAPITLGSHFQFKSDKDILDVSEPVTSLFNLDLTLLEKSLATIRFNERCGIDSKYISEGRQKLMTALDDKHSDYQNYLKNYKCKKPDVIFGSDSEGSDDSNGSEASPSKNSIVPEEPPLRQKGETDLEQWLDDVLDD